MTPVTPCLADGCGRFATYGGRCDEHRRTKARATYKERGSLYRKAKWLRTREKVLTEEPFCRMHKAEGKDILATQVDHIIPFDEGGDRWARHNLQPLCDSHHARKTRAEQRLG